MSRSPGRQVTRWRSPTAPPARTERSDPPTCATPTASPRREPTARCRSGHSAGGRRPGAVDGRLYDNTVWILRHSHLRVTAARQAGHHTHGDGTALDLIPAAGNTQAIWDASAGALANDLGWTPACARSGTRPACRLAPAIQFIGYDGYPDHGSPRTCGARCPAHIHVSWVSPCFGTSTLSLPCRWVTAFAAPAPDDVAANTRASRNRTDR